MLRVEATARSRDALLANRSRTRSESSSEKRSSKTSRQDMVAQWIGLGYHIPSIIISVSCCVPQLVFDAKAVALGIIGVLREIAQRVNFFCQPVACIVIMVKNITVGDP